MQHKNHRGDFIKKFFVIPSITSQVQSHREKQSKQMFDGHVEKHNAHLRRHFVFSKRYIPYTPIMLCKATYTYTKKKTCTDFYRDRNLSKAKETAQNQSLFKQASLLKLSSPTFRSCMCGYSPITHLAMGEVSVIKESISLQCNRRPPRQSPIVPPPCKWVFYFSPLVLHKM